MNKLILISVIIATIAAAALAARDPNPRRGVKRMLLFLLAFNAAYVALLAGFYARFYMPEVR